jgi:hypothetical protein
MFDSRHDERVICLLLVGRILQPLGTRRIDVFLLKKTN